MNGDIKLATLMDTTAETISATNIGLEAQSASGWTSFGSNTVEDDAGAVKITYVSHQAGAYARFRASEASSVDLEIGQTYILSFDVKTTGTLSGVMLYDYNGSSADINITGTISNTSYESHHYSFTYLGSAHPYLGLTGFGSGDVVWIKDFVLSEAEPDRSVNGNGLQVFGTVTKTAVATGADLVAYSGWSTSNYLYNPAFPAIGTQDYFVSLWVKPDSPSTSYSHLIAIDRQDSASTGATLKLWHGNGNAPYFYVAGATRVQSSTPLPNGVWSHVCGGRKNGVWYIYINGRLDTTGATANVTIGGTTGTCELTIGRNLSTGEYTRGAQSLTRVSLTFPTAEQIAKMYRDEKPLFQEGAQATLYGTSDAVTALAYDDDTELLHAGTSSGRSVFKGLQRVSNTTDAVGVAISASNDLVVEE
jgi:hypothetical protein